MAKKVEKKSEVKTEVKKAEVKKAEVKKAEVKTEVKKAEVKKFISEYDNTNILSKNDVKSAMSAIQKQSNSIINTLDSNSKQLAAHNMANIMNYKSYSENEYNTIEQDLGFVIKAELQLFYIKQLKK